MWRWSARNLLKDAPCLHIQDWKCHGIVFLVSDLYHHCWSCQLGLGCVGCFDLLVVFLFPLLLVPLSFDSSNFFVGYELGGCVLV